MAKARRLLLVTTQNDPSLELLVAGGIAAGLEPTVLSYGPDATNVLGVQYDFVYFRDPFNDASTAQSVAAETAQLVRAAQPQAYYVDHVSTFDAMMLEDKWEQYKLFGREMPRTNLLESFEHIPLDGMFIKKRISSRSKGIIFTVEDIPAGALPTDYIAQERLAITAEYRVFMMKGRIVLPAAIKSSKTMSQRSKVVQLAGDIDAAAKALCNRAYAQTGYDFMGLDIAYAGGKWYLLEVNRSCQFGAYHRLTGINLAEELCEALAISGAV